MASAITTTKKRADLEAMITQLTLPWQYNRSQYLYTIKLKIYPINLFNQSFQSINQSINSPASCQIACQVDFTAILSEQDL